MAVMHEGLSIKLESGSLWEMTDRAQVITLIGAGGKTTCLQGLTQEIYAAGYPVTATTTTKVYPDDKMQTWNQSDPPPCETDQVYFWYTEVEDGSRKWLGPSPMAVDEAILGDLGLSQRYWVVEGDGARERRLKCWASHEPQIPYRSDCGVLVIDGRLWGGVLKEEYVHRSELCKDLLNRLWTVECAWLYFLKSPVFWPQYQRLSWVILFNIPRQSDPVLNVTGENVHSKLAGDSISSDFHEAACLLEALNGRWLELEEQNGILENRPKRLRLAAGDAKEGRLQWFDLW